MRIQETNWTYRKLKLVFGIAGLCSCLGIGNQRLEAQATAVSCITLNLSETGGIALLGITEAHVDLTASDNGASGIMAGQRYTYTVREGEANGGRLHYTVHGQEGPFKITVRSLTPISAGSLTVAVTEPPTAGSGDGIRGTALSGAVEVTSAPRDLILGIGDCYTGTGPLDGPLLRYALVGNPGFSLGDIALEYKLTAGW